MGIVESTVVNYTGLGSPVLKLRGEPLHTYIYLVDVNAKSCTYVRPVTWVTISLASQPYFSSCACALEMGAGERKEKYLSFPRPVSVNAGVNLG